MDIKTALSELLANAADPVKQLQRGTGCEILAKAGSQSGWFGERPQRFTLFKSRRKGLLKPGGTVVEGTWQYWNWSSSYLQRQATNA